MHYHKREPGRECSFKDDRSSAVNAWLLILTLGPSGPVGPGNPCLPGLPWTESESERRVQRLHIVNNKVDAPCRRCSLSVCCPTWKADARNQKPTPKQKHPFGTWLIQTNKVQSSIKGLLQVMKVFGNFCWFLWLMGGDGGLKSTSAIKKKKCTGKLFPVVFSGVTAFKRTFEHRYLSWILIMIKPFETTQLFFYKVQIYLTCSTCSSCTNADIKKLITHIKLFFFFSLVTAIMSFQMWKSFLTVDHDIL